MTQAELTIREDAFGQMNMLRMLGDEDAANNLQEAINVAIAALRGPQPDPETGLMSCGCGGKAILFHQPDIEGPGSDGDKWAVFCEKECGMVTSDLTSREYAVEAWYTGMGYKGGAAMERIDKPIGFDSILQGGEKLSLPDYEIFSLGAENKSMPRNDDEAMECVRLDHVAVIVYCPFCGEKLPEVEE